MSYFAIRIFPLMIIAIVVLFGCDNSTRDSNANECSQGDQRCHQNILQNCVNGAWSDWADCTAMGLQCIVSEGNAWCSDGDTDADTDSDTDSDNDTDTDTDGDEELDSDTATYDCDNQPTLPRPFRAMSNFPFGEDFVFDRDGYTLNVTLENILTKTTYGGESTQIVPIGNDWIRGCRLLANGNAVIATPETNEIVRVTPKGSVTTLTTGIQANGIAVGMDGRLYVACSDGKIMRVQPETGEQTLIWADENVCFDGITFSPNYLTLYFDEEAFKSTDEHASRYPMDHRVFRLEMNPDGTPAGDATVLATINTHFLLDGMTCDECGNIYVVDMTGAIWQITPEGKVVGKVIDLTDYGGPGAGFITAVNFGSGFAGWHRDYLYIPTMGHEENQGYMIEIDVGLRGKNEPHLQ